MIDITSVIGANPESKEKNESGNAPCYKNIPEVGVLSTKFKGGQVLHIMIHAGAGSVDDVLNDINESVRASMPDKTITVLSIERFETPMSVVSVTPGLDIEDFDNLGLADAYFKAELEVVD